MLARTPAPSSPAAPPAPARSGCLVGARVLAMAAADGAWPGPRDQPWTREATAIVWAAGRVVLVGSDARASAEARRLGIPVTDAGGRIVLPGFVDAHTHFLHIGVKKTRPDHSKAGSRAEVLQQLASWLAAHPGPQPVIGELWDESAWADRTRPTRADIDQVVAAAARAGHGPADRPVVLRRVCGHVAVAGSGALPRIRARWDSDDLVDMDTGVLLEQPSLYLNEVLGEPPERLDAAVVAACAASHKLGITAVGDYSQAPYREALQRAARAGTLAVRVASSIYVQQLEAEIASGMRTGKRLPAASEDGGQGGAPRHDPGAWLRDGGLKVFLDGSLGARTAALRSRYLDDPGTPADCHGERKSRHGCVGHPHPNGTLNWSDADVERLFRAAAGAGIQLHAHAIGDAAIDQGLEKFALLAADGSRLPAQGPAGARDAAAGPVPASGLRHRFEHFEIHHDDQLATTARLGIVSSSQPNFVGTWSSKGGMYEDRLGDRFRLNNRFRSLKGAGIRVAFGSDGMPPGPLLGLEGAIAHPIPEQRLDPAEAIWHYTWAAAWSLHWEDAIGSLEEGKMADLVVLDTRALDGKPTSWGIKATVVDGTVRHGSLD